MKHIKNRNWIYKHYIRQYLDRYKTDDWFKDFSVYLYISSQDGLNTNEEYARLYLFKAMSKLGLGILHKKTMEKVSADNVVTQYEFRANAEAIEKFYHSFKAQPRKLTIR